MDEQFVLFDIPCICGTKLQVHGQYFKGGIWQGRDAVVCPKCKKEHELPTKPLRFFFQEGDHWVVSFLQPPRAESKATISATSDTDLDAAAPIVRRDPKSTLRSF